MSRSASYQLLFGAGALMALAAGAAPACASEVFVYVRQGPNATGGDAGGPSGSGGEATAGNGAGAGTTTTTTTTTTTGSGGAGGGPPPPPPVPDFELTDVNDTSPKVGTLVSPRDYLGQVSAWYFGSAL